MQVECGDITKVTSGVIVQQVNAQGVMASGVAKAIREKWPVVYEDYSKKILTNQPDKGYGYMGNVIFTPVSDSLAVASLVGQQFYGRDGKKYTSYDALDKATKLLDIALDAANIMDIHLPLIGCGLGGGDWNIVKAIFIANLGQRNLTLWRNDNTIPGVV